MHTFGDGTQTRKSAPIFDASFSFRIRPEWKTDAENKHGRTQLSYYEFPYNLHS